MALNEIGFPGATRTLNLYRMKTDPTVERRIGYRYGVDDASYDPIIIDCPTVCPAGSNLNYYQFQIDRLSADGSMVYARFTFEISFTAAGSYTAFFEGCCRPPVRAYRPLNRYQPLLKKKN